MTRGDYHVHSTYCDGKARPEAMVRAAYQSVCDICIVPIQDILGLDSDARMNTPGTVSEENWSWRLTDGMYDEKTEKRLYTLAKLYGRI